MNQEDLKHNLLDPQHWLRILFMVGYAFAAWVVTCLLGVLVVVQLVLALITGAANANLQKAGYQLVRYLAQILQFLLYNSEEKPFPLADFPSADGFEPPARSPRPKPEPAAAAPAAVEPVVETPVSEVPVAEAPVSEVPVAEAPVSEAPYVAAADESSTAAGTSLGAAADSNAGDSAGSSDQDKPV